MRRFEFDPGVSIQAATDVAAAALDDEGLELRSGAAGPLDRITTVVSGGRMALLVPDTRISPRTDGPFAPDSGQDD